MKHQNDLRNLLSRKGIVSLNDPETRGFPSVYFHRMVAEGLAERIAPGVYASTTAPLADNMDFSRMARAVPAGVICLLSALRVHGLTLENPHQTHVALPRGVRAPKNGLPGVYYHFAPAIHAWGVEERTAPHGPFRVYGLEKTVCDCFRFRNAIGSDVAVRALKEAFSRGLVDRTKLWEAMKICRMTRVMRPFVETLA